MGCASRRTLDGTNGRDERPGLHRLLSIRNSTPHLSRPTANEISTRPEDGRTAQASPGETVRDRSLSFLKLLGDGDAVQTVRMFIMLLFLAFEGKIGLNQMEEFRDIEIEMRNDGSAVSD